MPISVTESGMTRSPVTLPHAKADPGIFSTLEPIVSEKAVPSEEMIGLVMLASTALYVSEVNAAQPLNAYCPISSTPSPIVTLASAPQLANAYPPM